MAVSIEDIDIDDPAEFEALMLRLWARHVRFQCWLSEQPDPPGACEIVHRGSPFQQIADSEAFKRWCDKHGLEFLVYDAQTGDCVVMPSEDKPSDRQHLRVVEP